MNDLQIIRVFDSMAKNPEKYLRVCISKNGAFIHIPDNIHLAITSAILAEFIGDDRTYFYQYDASQSPDLNPDFKCIVAMKKNKELAYISGNFNDDYLSGYIRCKPPKEDDDNEFEDCENNSGSFFFGVVTTKSFTIIFAADTQHSKTFKCEILRSDEDKPSLEDIILTLSQFTNREVHYEQEKQESK